MSIKKFITVSAARLLPRVVPSILMGLSVLGPFIVFGDEAPEAGFSWRPFPLEDADRPQYQYWQELVTLGETRARRLQADHDILDHHPDGNYYPRPDTVGEGPYLIIPRGFARPGDRWVEVFVQLDEALDPGDVELKAELWAVDGAAPVEEFTLSPETGFGKLNVDLRRHDLENGRLRVALYQGGERLGTSSVSLQAHPTERPLEAGERIRIDLDVPDGVSPDRAAPLTFGVPFPAGALWDAGAVRLVNDAGEEVPSQIELTGRWASDGSIQWLRFDTVAVPNEGLHAEYAPPSEDALPALPLTLETTGDGVIGETGVARYELAKGASPIRAIWRNGQPVARADDASGLYVIDQQDRRAVACADGEEIRIESEGPLAASVRFEGFYRTEDGEELARHITRLEFFAGQPQAHVTHTLVLTRDSGEVWFKEIGWEFEVEPGADARAVFGASHVDWEESISQPVDGETKSAHIFQEEHLIFSMGEKRFSVGAERSDGELEVLYEGKEMGDWAMLIGEEGGLAASVHDAARQHPKEFEVLNDRLIIRLFSNRAGEELDFRLETLADKWRLSDEHREEMIRRAERRTGPSNAIGWAKTHRLMIAPVQPETREAAAEVVRSSSEPIYANVDPHWLYVTEAMGPMHLVDHENYPELEAWVENALAPYTTDAVHLETGGRISSFNGFMDYNVGPIFSGRASRGNLAGERRFTATYGMRPALWTIYARSGDRVLREFAAGSTRAFTDNKIAHWEGPNKEKGLFVDSPRGPGPRLSPGDMPMYWQGETALNILEASNLNTMLHDYYLTGNRRAADTLRLYSDGVKDAWDPELSAGRPSQTFQSLAQAYSFTDDPDLRPLIEASFALFYNVESDIGCWGSTDKPWSTSADIYIGWEMFGTPVHYDLAMRLATWNFFRELGRGPPDRGHFIRAASFLFRNTNDPFAAQAAEFWVRRFNTARLPGTVESGAFQIAGLAQDILENWGPEERARVSWVAWRDDLEDAPVGVAVDKQEFESMDLHIHTRGPGEFRGGDWVRALGPAQRWRDVGDRTFVSMDVQNNTQGPGISAAGTFVNTRVRFAYEAPEESYIVRPPHAGMHYTVARLKDRDLEGYRLSEFPELVTPPRLVVVAPLGWRVPTISQSASRPEEGEYPADIYFKVPEGVNGAAIYFSEESDREDFLIGTKLFGPDGEPFNDGEPVQGWIKIPEGQHGLWHFRADGLNRESLKGQRIKVVNLPPFFAFDRPESYFEPEIPWVEWHSPPPSFVIDQETPLEFTIHLAGEGEVSGVKVYLGEELIYEGAEPPRDLVLDPGSFKDAETDLRVKIKGEEYETESALRVKTSR